MNKLIVFVLIVAIAAVGVGAYLLMKAPAPKEEGWVKEGALISGGYCDAEVVKLDNGTYRMYYGTFHLMHGGKIEILSATSTDGLTWENESGIRLSDGAMPSVVRLDNGSWRMYYTGPNGIYSAISEDGLEFVKEDMRLSSYNNVRPRSSTVVRLDNGSWRMYYCEDSSGYVDSAISGDGLSWTTESGVRVDSTKPPLGGMIDGPDIIKLPSGVFRLYFWSFSAPAGGGIYRADSEDGLTFSSPSPVLVYQEPWEYGGGGVSSPGDPSVIQMPDGNWRMYYGISGQIHGAKASSI